MFNAEFHLTLIMNIVQRTEPLCGNAQRARARIRLCVHYTLWLTHTELNTDTLYQSENFMELLHIFDCSRSDIEVNNFF